LSVLTHEQVRTQFHLLQNLLSPAALDRRFPVQVVDHGRPLATRFGSRAAIVGGFTRYDRIDSLIEGLPSAAAAPVIEQAQKLVGYQAAINGDACYRDDTLGIVADVTMHFPHETMRDFAETIGIDRNRYVTREQSLSEVADKPTIFEFTKQCVLPAGKPVFDVTRWTLVTSPLPVHMGWYAEAIGHLDGSTFRGTYSSRMLAEPKGGPLQIRQWIFMRGTFAVELRTL
jgi:hypothetical protein